jgi:beta-lactamase regulating signal transducer with metallopeptidase domain
MINYILQIILFQVLFLAVYDFFLSKETFFTKNRWYLLSTSVLSFLLPLIKISTFQKVVPQEYIVYLPEIVLSPEKVIQSAIETSLFPQSINYITILFWIGACVFSIVFLLKLTKIINLIRKYHAEKKADFTLIFIPKKRKAFSFFNYIFLGKEIPESQLEKIIQHELVHSKQKHSLDLLFFEFLKIVMWFNPMIYLYQKRITLLHEYISDEFVAKSETKEIYINNLLSNFFQVENISFINQFYKPTFIKKRIIMITKTQSKKMNQLKYLVLIPVLASMLFYTSCSENAIEEEVVKKELFKMYTLKSGELQSFESEVETYLDVYLGKNIPKKFTEITYIDLNSFEKIEFDKMKIRLENEEKSIKLSLFKMKNGRKVIAMILFGDNLKKELEIKEASFMTIEKAPTFPGCEPGDKDCFSKMIQKHFANNFRSEMINELGLKSGKKKIFISFKIDKEGNIIDIKARAPHTAIEEEVIKVMSTLPKIIPGENNGEKVAVSYSVPFAIVVK